MKKIAIQIPIKFRQSERVPNKNFFPLNGKPLCYWVLDRLVQDAPAEWDIFIDSENINVYNKLSQAHRERFLFHKRNEVYAENNANGNHLMQQFIADHDSYDVYVQLFVTAVLLSTSTMISAVNKLIENDEHDSLLLVSIETGWVWHKGKAINYRPDEPDGLPRSQDATYLKETTGMYGIHRQAALSTGCRIGKRPYFMQIPRIESLDIDNIEDIHEAQGLL